MTNHTTSIEIKGQGVDTQGYFSYNNPQNLIIFVHGFGGTAKGTWNDFPSILLFDPKFNTSDIIFYGYDTFKGQAGDHALELYAFINKCIAPLNNKILPELQKLPERTYDRIIFVAHSLGAVLVRQAQLSAVVDKKPWVHRSELALYAPAHHGAELIALAMQALPGLSGLLGIFGKLAYPILTDLDAHDNGILKSIKSETETLQKQGMGDFSKAKLVVYAKGDKVVKNIPYLYDKPAIVIPNKSHISVCKPIHDFLQPAELLSLII